MVKSKFYWIVPAFFLSIALLVGVVALARLYWYKPEVYLQTRTHIISEQLGQVASEGEPFAVVVGNSLVERNHIAKLCDLPVVNAGVGRSRIADLTEIARVARAGQADIRVLSIGVNDVSRCASLESFEADYSALYSILEPTHVVGITGKRRDEFNALIRKIGGRSHYIEPLSKDMLQPDGIHYTMAGASEWKARLEKNCSDRF